MIKNVDKEVLEIVKWIKNYVVQSHADGVVIGNSGGKDSATVIALACRALKKENVLTVAMPCKSIPDDIADAKLVANTFEVPLLEIDITNTYNTLENEIDRVLKFRNISIKNESKINAKPRLRMTTLYYIAQSLNYLVLGTGNKCESLVGYTTKWGDSACDFNPIGDFTVEEVLQIGKYLGVPNKIIEKAPNDGLGGLSDEEKLGVTYKQIAEYIETCLTDENAKKIIEIKEKISMHKRIPIPIYRRLPN